MKVKVGLLIDLNGFPRFPKEDDFFNDENSPLEDGFSTISSNSCRTETDAFCFDTRLQAKVKQLQEYILEQLTKDGTVRGKFSSADFQFTYRYFNSATYVHPLKELRNFMPLDVGSFETFEKSLETEVRTFVANGNETSPESNRMTLMSSAFKGMVSDFDWHSVSRRSSDSLPKIKSSSSLKSSDSISPLTDAVDDSTRNVLYVFFRVPRDMPEMELFVDDVPEKLDIVTSSKQFLNAFVSKAFLEMITRTYQMRVNFVDMWALHDQSYEDLRSVNYPNSILKVLRHLHGGQVLHPVSNMTMTPGLPSWKTFLKNNLRASSTSSVSGSMSVISHVSESTRCSTPMQNTVTKLPGSKSGPNSERKTDVIGTDRSRMRKDILLKSQSQSSILMSQDFSRTRELMRVQPRFSNNGQILVRKAGRSSVLPLSRDSLHFLTRKSSETIIDTQQSSSCPNPKKVRRNLFTASQEPSEEIKRLLASTAKFNFSRSPSRSNRSVPRSLFMSPRATTSALQQPEFKSPGTSSVLKSRRQLDMGHFSGSRSSSLSLSPLSMTIGLGYGTASPVNVLSGLICPESPSTPPSKRVRAASFSLSSCEKREFVPESPDNSKFKKLQSTRRDSFNFYCSSSSESFTTKSKGWEQAGTTLQKARIKDSVDLSQMTHSSLSLEDLELIDSTGSPLTKQIENIEMPSC